MADQLPIDKVNAVVAKLRAGAITYEQYLAEVQPHVDEMNARGKEIAKQFGKKFKPFVARQFTR